MTKKTIEGRVNRVRGQEGLFEFNLVLFSEAISRYSYRLLQIQYPPTLYPLDVRDLVNEIDYMCENEEVFIKHLGEILSSEKVRKVVLGLIAQSEAMTKST